MRKPKNKIIFHLTVPIFSFWGSLILAFPHFVSLGSPNFYILCSTYCSDSSFYGLHIWGFPYFRVYLRFSLN